MQIIQKTFYTVELYDFHMLHQESKRIKHKQNLKYNFKAGGLCKTVAFHHSWKYDRVMDQLKMLHLKSEAIWVDAGCGTGTFTFPMSTLVNKVIAVDQNLSRITHLRKSLPNNANIIPLLSDFNHDRYTIDPVDGILFGFSLHYQQNPLIALKNAYSQTRPGGSVVVFEYGRKTPLPWVPHPIPVGRGKILLVDSGFIPSKIIFQNKRFYILKGIKNLVNSKFRPAR
ncbi:MAG: class I SAM-dependent methyltransferase [Candidatus Thorarchaeota archaeon]